MINKNYKSVYNILNIVLVLMSFVNGMEIFLPRTESQQSFVRLPIQIGNLLILILMLSDLFLNKIVWNKITKSIGILILLLIIHTFYYLISNVYYYKDVAQYVRFLTWTISILFFYSNLLKFGIRLSFFKVYIFVFIIVVTKQIYEAALFSNEKLNGGDTASLPLLFIITIALTIFGKQTKLAIVLICTVLIVISLRRTAIITLFFCLPFFYNYIKRDLKIIQIVILLFIVIIGASFLWNTFGNLLLIRFKEITEGGEDGSYGSGRSSFYLIVWNDWLNGNESILLGNGLTSVKNLFSKKSEIELHHAHNDLLEILYTFGLLGISIWFYFINSFWALRKRLKQVNPQFVNIFYMLFISFMTISISSGTILRISTIALAMSLSLLMYYSNIKMLNKANG